tara:strand:+ start:312 stop:542 length:231 start_codon:yes stop_codon:yes gene_type:complete
VQTRTIFQEYFYTSTLVMFIRRIIKMGESEYTKKSVNIMSEFMLNIQSCRNLTDVKSAAVHCGKKLDHLEMEIESI